MSSELQTGVYCILNKINGKKYIGSTASQSFRRRWAEHVSRLRKNRHHSGHLQASWNRYGEGSFAFEVLERCEPDIAIPREQFYLDWLETYRRENGYNILPCACSRRGAKMRPETLEKIMATRSTPEYQAKIQAIQEDPEFKERFREACKLAQSNPELRARVSASLKKTYTENQELRARRVLIWKGRKHSEETKRKMSESGSTPEMRAKKSMANKGKLKSDETRAKMSEGQKRCCQNPETRQRKSDGAKKGWQTRRENEAAKRQKDENKNEPPV